MNAITADDRGVRSDRRSQAGSTRLTAKAGGGGPIERLPTHAHRQRERAREFRKFVFAEVWPGVARWVRMIAASLRLALGSGLPSSQMANARAVNEPAAALVVRALACQTLVPRGSET
jgi:hypothetical protein